jgi:tetratricopeptide (TPR) repeat protein/transcriptional regulator with XRE-family HTH domain
VSREPRRQSQPPADTLAAAAGSAGSLEDLAELLRTLRRRHARSRRDTPLTYRELAARTGWSQAAIAEYFTARTLPPTDRFDALAKALGAAPAEQRALADARDRVEENQRRSKARPPATAAEQPARGDRAPGSIRAAPRQLPPDTALFTGRDEELAVLLTLPDQQQGDSPGTVVISAIEGMGGIGKTALAVRAGHRLAARFPDGQLFIDLYGFTQDTSPREPGDALATLLSGLGVPPQQIPAQPEARAAVYRDRLAGTRTLIVLDNAADEAQVRPLLPATSSCLVIVTSRRRLKALDDALPLSLDVLPPQEAVTLLRTAARLNPAPQDEPLLARTAELCGHLPLALLIAGALLRTGGKAWNLPLLIDRLGHRRTGDELAGYTDETRSLRAAFDLSYQHLPTDLQALFRRVGLVPGPEIDAHAATALLEVDPRQAARLLERLADHSLLIGAAPGRYRLHDLVRVHARTQAACLDREEERTQAVDRLLHYYAHTAQIASMPIAHLPRRAPDGPRPAHALEVQDVEAARAWLRTEYPNLAAAHAHARAHSLDRHTIALAAGTAEILSLDGPFVRALEIHRAAAEAAERRHEPAARATALTDLGRALNLTGDFQAAADTLTQALEIHRALGDRHGEAGALTSLGQVRLVAGDFQAAADTQSRALEIYRRLGNRHGEAGALTNLGQVRLLTGDFAAAADTLARALRIYRLLGNRHGEATALTRLGQVRYSAGDIPGAVDAQTRALELHRGLGNSHGEATALTNLGQVQLVAGDFAAAADAQSRALEIYRQLGNRQGEATALTYLARGRFATGDFPAAAQTLAQALEIHRPLGNRHGEATALAVLGEVQYSAGNHAAAADSLAQALAIYRQVGHHANEAYVLNHYAATVAALGDRAQALSLYHRALEMNRELHKPDDEAISLEGIADHHIAGGDPAQGAAFLRQALEIYRHLGMPADSERVQGRLSALAAR